MPSMMARKSSRFHLHAVDDGEEVLALKAERAHRRRAVRKPRRRTAGVQRVDVVAPCLQRGAARLARARRVGDVIDLAAETVDLEHGLALRARQDAHRRVERAAGRDGPVIRACFRRL
jgi:hypothetical protein